MARSNRRTSRPRRRKKLVLPPVNRRSEGERHKVGRWLLLGVMVLVGINLYAFVWGRKSLRNVYRAAQVSKEDPKAAKKKTPSTSPEPVSRTT